MPDTTARTALVTGASVGIGFELAREFARQGYDLVLVSRSEERLAEAARIITEESNVALWTIALDLSLPGAPAILYDSVRELDLEVTTLVNNAGFGWLGPCTEQPLENQMEILSVNVVALTALTALFLPSLQASGRGEVLNVASTAGFQAGPWMAIYFATKAYVLHYTEALAWELRGSDVKVCCLCPGPTRTEFGKRAGSANTLLLRAFSGDPGPVAKAGFRALRKGRAICVPGFSNRAATLVPRLLPRFVVRRIVNMLNSQVSP